MPAHVLHAHHEPRPRLLFAAALGHKQLHLHVARRSMSGLALAQAGGHHTSREGWPTLPRALPEAYGTARARSLASQAAGQASFGATKAALSGLGLGLGLGFSPSHQSGTLRVRVRVRVRV